ncbi:MucR family transcriptional regulator [Caulobacter sp. S45]|uniref:MucR family transcriptional regulator n=1 Tax=Caulobacter sp. S45 TaxID=1641861 RepID=UPI001C203718
MIDLTAHIVSAYVSNNEVPVGDLPGLIASVYKSLDSAGQAAVAEVADTKRTAAEIRKSVGADHLISFLDGRPYKSLTRHLNSQGLSPQAYRERFGLPTAYPMVAPGYSAQRSASAKSFGFGGKRAAPVDAPAAPAPVSTPPESAAPKAAKPARKPAAPPAVAKVSGAKTIAKGRGKGLSR